MYALKIIDDIKNGVLVVDHSKTLLEYINEYMTKDTSDKIQEMADAFGLNFDEFKNIVTTSKNEMEWNEHDRFNTLLKTVDTDKANKYFLDKEGVDLQGLKLKSRTNRELKEFILGKKEEWWKRGVNYGIGNCRFCIVWEIEEEIRKWKHAVRMDRFFKRRPAEGIRCD